ncbi:protealysin inhibitor emfourin [Curtobacterium sp. PhB115]|uniref:protealysin inhibitor emfourin n=1 Tax=Curtobacterium sp. PhB115 TaxID=2485173 RepID=UPI000F4BB37D|nr:protealysin inhibitor emfourin [Curtobacterium sp. PhB115]ROP74143.1 hypothetical protein EDF19_0219 [Curtobacterium sp. PhB115]
MHIDVRRSGGFAGTTRRWEVDTDASDDPGEWSEVLDALPQQEPGAPTPEAVPARPVPDDFTWTITVARTTVTIPGSRLDGPWADLVARVRSAGHQS